MAALLLLVGCDDEKGGNKDAAGSATATATTAATGAKSLDARCDQLGKACGEEDKHKEAITKECRAAATAQQEAGCSDKVIAAYDCYDNELCGKIKKIWALDDFRVLTKRHNMCIEAHDAAATCGAAK